MSKATFTEKLSHVILHGMASAPFGQADPAIVAEVRRFVGEPRTLTEQYDFIATLGKKADVSSFVRALCDVEMHYARPDAAQAKRRGAE